MPHAQHAVGHTSGSEVGEHAALQGLLFATEVDQGSGWAPGSHGVGVRGGGIGRPLSLEKRAWGGGGSAPVSCIGGRPGGHEHGDPLAAFTVFRLPRDVRWPRRTAASAIARARLVPRCPAAPFCSHVPRSSGAPTKAPACGMLCPGTAAPHRFRASRDRWGGPAVGVGAGRIGAREVGPAAGRPPRSAKRPAGRAVGRSRSVAFGRCGLGGRRVGPGGCAAARLSAGPARPRQTGGQGGGRAGGSTFARRMPCAHAMRIWGGGVRKDRSPPPVTGGSSGRFGLRPAT